MYRGLISCIILLSMDNCNICIKLCLSHSFTHFPSYCYSMCNLSLTTHPCLTCTYTTYSAISSFLSFFSSPALSPVSPLLPLLLLFLANLHCIGGGSCSIPSTLCTCLKAIRRRACWEELAISSLSWLVSSCAASVWLTQGSKDDSFHNQQCCLCPFLPSPKCSDFKIT